MPAPGYRGPRKECQVRLKKDTRGVPAGTVCRATFFEYYKGTVDGRPFENLTPHYTVVVAGSKIDLPWADVEEVQP